MKNNKFDELAKGVAQSVTRRQALKKFGLGVAGMALACFGLANVAKAGNKTPCLPIGYRCGTDTLPCCGGLGCYPVGNGSDGSICAHAPKHSKGGYGTGGA